MINGPSVPAVVLCDCTRTSVHSVVRDHGPQCVPSAKTMFWPLPLSCHRRHVPCAATTLARLAILFPTSATTWTRQGCDHPPRSGLVQSVTRASRVLQSAVPSSRKATTWPRPCWCPRAAPTGVPARLGLSKQAGLPTGGATTGIGMRQRELATVSAYGHSSFRKSRQKGIRKEVEKVSPNSQFFPETAANSSRISSSTSSIRATV